MVPTPYTYGHFDVSDSGTFIVHDNYSFEWFLISIILYGNGSDFLGIC